MIDPDSKWTHNRDGYDVTVVKLSGGEGIKVKDANDAAWQEGVAYCRLDGALGGTVYVRSVKDFEAKFTNADMQDEGDQA